MNATNIAILLFIVWVAAVAYYAYKRVTRKPKKKFAKGDVIVRTSGTLLTCEVKWIDYDNERYSCQTPLGMPIAVSFSEEHNYKLQ